MVTLPAGTFTLLRHMDGRIEIEHADPIVKISHELLKNILAGKNWGEFPQVTLTTPWRCSTPVPGSILRIEAINRTLIYRLGDRLTERFWVAEWPD